MSTEIAKAVWNQSYVDSLPDSAFLMVEPGERKEGRTSPSSLRHFPVYDANGQLDLPHLRTALARLPQTTGDWLSAADRERLTEKARKLLVDATKSTHQRAAGLQEWAMGYVAHLDAHEALGVTGESVAKAWPGDLMIGRRAAQLLRGLVLKTKDRASKRITKPLEKVLRLKVALHNASTPPPKFRARIGTAKAVYQRGVAAYQGSARPCVKSAPQWGFARVEALLSYCKTGALPHPAYTADLDLFPKTGVRKAGTADELPPEQAEQRTFAGLPVVLDRPKGFVQRKLDDAGKLLWERTYTTDYGYIPSTLGGDSEELDVFLGPDESAPTAFWVVQTDDEGDFDEYKVILGVTSEEEARGIYTAHVPETYLGRVFETPIGILHALLGLEPDDLLKAIEPGWHFVADAVGALYTAHPWSQLVRGAMPPGEDGEENTERVPTGPLTLSAEAHAAMAAAVSAVKALLPAETGKFVTPLAVDGAPPAKDTVALFSPPDPYVADLEAILTAAEGAPAALIEMPESPRHVAHLAKLGGVFRIAGVPGRVFVATYPLPRSSMIQPIEEEAMVWGRGAEEDAIDAELASDPDDDDEDGDDDAADDVEKDVDRDAHGQFAGGGGGNRSGGGHHVGNGNKAHQQRMDWGKLKAKETGKPVHVLPDKKSDPNISGGVKLSYKAPKKGPYSTIHPNGSVSHTKALTESTAKGEVGKVGTFLQIGKADGTDERYTLGIVLVPDEPDLQGDVYDAPTIRRAADIFITDYQNTALQHSVKPAEIQAFRAEHPELYNGKILIVDSFVIPAEMGDVTINGRLVKAGTWLLGHRWVDDALWSDVRAGKYTGLSMGGFARRVALADTPAPQPA